MTAAHALGQVRALAGSLHAGHLLRSEMLALASAVVHYLVVEAVEVGTTIPPDVLDPNAPVPSIEIADNVGPCRQR
jgi:hypothetical protein